LLQKSFPALRHIVAFKTLDILQGTVVKIAVWWDLYCKFSDSGSEIILKIG